MKPYRERDGKRVWLSDAEIEQLIDETEDTEQRIAVKLAARAGLRRSEVVQITPKDVVRSERGSTFIRVWEDVAKKNHYRETPIPNGLATEITTAVDLLDIDDREELVDYTDKTVYRWVKRAAGRLEEKTGDEGWGYVDVHDLRRSWATRILSEGVLPSVLMDWGGWEDWDTFREHYLGEFSPEVVERERRKVGFLADGEPLDAQPASNNVVPSSSSSHYADD